MKFCKDCKYHFSGKCQSPDAEDARDPIDGEWPTARSMRSTSLWCGHSAFWYEPTYPKKDK